MSNMLTAVMRRTDILGHQIELMLESELGNQNRKEVTGVRVKQG